MGANFDYKIYKTSDYKEALKRWEEDVEYAEEYYGHQEGYSGAINSLSSMSKIDKTFDSVDEVVKFAEDLSTGEGVAFKVLIDMPKKTKTFIKLEERLKKKEEEIDFIYLKALTRIRSAKSKTIGCKRCNRRVDRSSLREASCECGETFLTKAEIKSLQTKKGQSRDLKEKIFQAKENLQIGKDYGWFFGGWCRD